MNFDVEKDSIRLREMVGKFDTDEFLSHIAVLLSMIGPPIPYKPFDALDSPMKMLTYMGGLNIYAKNDHRIAYKANEVDWKAIVLQMVRVKAGYYDKFMPPEDADKSDYYQFYRISMPVFMDYFNTGPTNFEEQEIERISRMFTPFNEEISKTFKLSVADFIAIYNAIDYQLFLNLNRYSTLLKDGRDVQLWRRIDFTAKDERQNNVVRTTYINSNNFNLKAEINKLPMQISDQDRLSMEAALKRGDRILAVIKRGANREKVMIEAAPHLNKLSIVDEQGEKVNLTNSLKAVTNEDDKKLSDTTKDLANAEAQQQGQNTRQSRSQRA